MPLKACFYGVGNYLHKMDFYRMSCLLLMMCFVKYSAALLWRSPGDSGLDGVRKASRWNVPWLGVGLWCNGCPPKSCEDDDAIIHGYCCGCAYALDKLPVLCPEFLQCPLNLHGLCHDYEYMMRCCC